MCGQSDTCRKLPGKLTACNSVIGFPPRNSSPASNPNPCPHPYKRSLRARKPNRPVLALLPSSKNASLCLQLRGCHIMCTAALPRSRRVYDRHMVPSTCSCFSAFMPSSDPWPCCQRSASRSMHSRCGQRAYQANKPCLAQHRCTPWISAWRWLPLVAPSPRATVYLNHSGHTVQSNGANTHVPKPGTRGKPAGKAAVTYKDAVANLHVVWHVQELLQLAADDGLCAENRGTTVGGKLAAQD